jgi:hypothetical protein
VEQGIDGCEQRIFSEVTGKGRRPLGRLGLNQIGGKLQPWLIEHPRLKPALAPSRVEPIIEAQVILLLDRPAPVPPAIAAGSKHCIGKPRQEAPALPRIGASCCLRLQRAITGW